MSDSCSITDILFKKKTNWIVSEIYVSMVSWSSSMLYVTVLILHLLSLCLGFYKWSNDHLRDQDINAKSHNHLKDQGIIAKSHHHLKDQDINAQNYMITLGSDFWNKNSHVTCIFHIINEEKTSLYFNNWNYLNLKLTLTGLLYLGIFIQ